MVKLLSYNVTSEGNEIQLTIQPTSNLHHIQIGKKIIHKNITLYNPRKPKTGVWCFQDFTDRNLFTETDERPPKLR